MKILISNASPFPIYEQISRQVSALILSGELVAGQALPSIRALARDLQVSVITVKRSYDDLEAAGFLNSVNGKGTFVAAQNEEFLKEQHRRRVEEDLARAVDRARAGGMDFEELERTLRLLWEE
jgi:GntR family transcriptional regulator